MEKPLAGSNPMLHFQIRTPSTGVRPPTTLFHGLLGADGIKRGVRLFLDLVRRANQGEAVGISYKGFVQHVHGARFDEHWSQSHAKKALDLGGASHQERWGTATGVPG